MAYKYMLATLVIAGLGLHFTNNLHSQMSQPIEKRIADPVFEAGSKWKGKIPACFRIVDEVSVYNGCEFFSDQGAMYIRITPDSKESKWALIFNKKVKCLGNGPDFVDENTVEKIDCPEDLYK